MGPSSGADDACLPAQVTDFVFDLCDSVTLSQITEEQVKLYKSTFRELCQKYFSTSPWPSPQSIASECNGHPLFLAIYREVTHRHWFSTSRPNLRDRIEGWNVYRELLEELLDEENMESNELFLLPDWVFDILHEFVYQFQGFCQVRATVYASAKKHNVSLDDISAANPDSLPRHLLDNLSLLQQNSDAWAVESVTSYLGRLITIGSAPKAAAAYHYLAIFSSITLSRLECLLGDYQGCLDATSFLLEAPQKWTVQHKSDPAQTASEVVMGVFGARLSYNYHAGVAYLMTRRYKDATRILGDICSYMQRGFKTGQLHRLVPNADQLHKLYDRMIALLAILTHICPPAGLVEDTVLKTIREKHSAVGSNNYKDLFVFASPKFISPTAECDTYSLQIRQFQNEMSIQATHRKLRSYLKLYTSIPVSKLAKFHDMPEAEFLPLLLSYKHKMRQAEVGADEGGELKSAMDIHYHLQGDLVHVDEAEKQRRFENYFMAQITQNLEITRDVSNISTAI